MAATEESIYNRLASAPQYHPSNASLFADWNTQAGDVVQIKSDDSVYDVPIYNLKLKWNGASKIDVESTGNPEREPLPALKRREYSSNSSNYAAQKSYGGGLGSSLEKIANINGIMYAAGLQVDPVSGVLLYASEHGSDYALGSSFKVQSDAITAEVTRATNAEGQMSSRITQTADAITAEVTRATTAEGQMSTRITQTADAIELKANQTALDATNSRVASAEATLTVQAGQISSKVSETDFNGNTIASKINQTATTVEISASKINLSGYVTASQLEATDAKITNLTSGNATASALYANAIRANNYFIVGSHGAYWLSKSVVTSLNTTTTSVTGSKGTAIDITYAYSANKDTIYYLGNTTSA